MKHRARWGIVYDDGGHAVFMLKLCVFASITIAGLIYMVKCG